MYTKIDLSSTEYQNLRRDILRRVGFNRSLNLASKKTDDEVYAKAYRNASGRIDTFFEKMNDANYKLQWFEIDKLPEMSFKCTNEDWNKAIFNAINNIIFCD